MKKFIYAFSLVFMLCAISCGDDGDEPNTPSGDNSTSKVETFTVNGVSFSMVKVDGGTFQMGATEGQPIGSTNTPVHKVTLSNYSIGQTEVTLELWRAVMGSVPSTYHSDYGYAVLNQLPVVHISWNDCHTFILKLNELTGKKFRLPTEAEWEFAARGGNKTHGYVYSGGNDLDLVAWHGRLTSMGIDANSSNALHPVATKLPNELNIYDMSGNVTEFCSDYWGEYSSEAQTNPKGPSTHQYGYRVERGGDGEESGDSSWAVSTRGYVGQESPNDFKGFRLAL